jgi:superfamily I DNA/RNA helicase
MLNNFINLLIMGLAGTGKSSYLINQINHYIALGLLELEQTLMLMFNSSLRNSCTGKLFPKVISIADLERTVLKYIKNYNDRIFLLSVYKKKDDGKFHLINITGRQKRLLQRILEQNPYYRNTVHTIHSFCFQVLKQLNKLPDVFIGNKRTDLSEYPQHIQKQAFNKLISRFLILSKKELWSVIGNKYKMIAVSEYQDMTRDHIKVIKKIKEVSNGSYMIIEGDRFQYLYGYLNKIRGVKIRENFKYLAVEFPDNTFKKKILRHNWRIKNPNILYLVNDFLKTKLNVTAEYLYDIPEDIVITKQHRKPELTLFNCVLDELYNVTGLADTYIEHNEIYIIARWNKQLYLYKKYYECEQYKRLSDIIFQSLNQTVHKKDRILLNTCYTRNNKTKYWYFNKVSIKDRIRLLTLFKKHGIKPDTSIKVPTVSTIHLVKGSESTVVFYIGFNAEVGLSDDTEGELYIINTALTRATNKLFISSSFDKSGLFEFFNPQYIKIIDKQHYTGKTYKIDKQVDRDIEMSGNELTKLITTINVDSIELRTEPYAMVDTRYIERNCERSGSFNMNKYVNDDGLNCLVKYCNTHRYYGIECNELYPLTLNGFTSLEKVKYAINEFQSKFSSRLNNDSIAVNKIDLCKCYVFETYAEYLDFKRAITGYLYLFRRDKFKKSVYGYNGKGDDSNGYINSMDKLTMYYGTPHTLYFNLYSSKNVGFTIKIYNPATKTNGNAIMIDGKFILKMEIECYKEALLLHDVIGSNSVRDIMHWVSSSDRVRELFYRILNHYLLPYDIGYVQRCPSIELFGYGDGNMGIVK